ncbi:MAG: universal stress protein [Acidobacteriota bacterium]
MTRLTTLVCPVDMSDASRRALDYAALLARWYAASVRVVHVLPVLHAPEAHPTVAATPLYSPAEREAVRRELAAFAEPALDGVPHEVLLDEGFIVEQILSEAERSKAELIVMGTHGRGGLERLAPGSVTEKVLRRTRGAVLVVPPKADPAPSSPGPFTSILCAVDFSEASAATLAYARTLAAEAKSPLTLIHVLDWPGHHDHIELLSPVLSEYRRRRESEATRQLKALADDVKAEGIPVTEILAQGKPYQEIVRTATNVVADLIVIGLHGRNALNQALFGSTTHRVVREAPCPVLAVQSVRA